MKFRIGTTVVKYIETLESVQSQKSSILLPPKPPLQLIYENKSDVSNKSNPLHNIPVLPQPKKRGRKAASQGLHSNVTENKCLLFCNSIQSKCHG